MYVFRLQQIGKLEIAKLDEGVKKMLEINLNQLVAKGIPRITTQYL